jgi:hypothetical protein
MSSASLTRLSVEELHAEVGAVLPPKEVLQVPLLDLNLDVDLALALAAPIDLAVAANANAAIPINAAVGANVLSALSVAGAQATQDMPISQAITGDAIAQATQDSTITQTADPPVAEPPPGTTPEAVVGLLNINAEVSLDADLAAPIAGAVAANANVAAPINAAVSANVAALGSESIAVAEQTGGITQSIEGSAQATADQVSEINQ